MKTLNAAQMAWLAVRSISYTVDSKGRESFQKGSLELSEASDGSYVLTNHNARPTMEEMISADGSPWGCSEVVAIVHSRRIGLEKLAGGL
jgi:hypothetical protein